MARQETAVFTNMCMLTRADGKMLFQKRVDPDWPGVVFPGGHVEAGESFYASVIREMREETGLSVKAPQLCGVKQFQTKEGARYVVMLYRASQYEGELRSSREGEVLWLSAEEAQRIGYADGFAEMLQLFLDDSLSEMIYTKENGEWRCDFY